MWVNRRYDSIRGTIESRWKLEGDRLTLDATALASVSRHGNGAEQAGVRRAKAGNDVSPTVIGGGLPITLFQHATGPLR